MNERCKTNKVYYYHPSNTHPFINYHCYPNKQEAGSSLTFQSSLSGGQREALALHRGGGAKGGGTGLNVEEGKCNKNNGVLIGFMFDHTRMLIIADIKPFLIDHNAYMLGKNNSLTFDLLQMVQLAPTPARLNCLREGVGLKQRVWHKGACPSGRPAASLR